MRALSEHDGPPTPAATSSGRSTSATSAPCRRCQWSSSTSSRHPVEPGATTSSPCRLHGLLPASPRGPHEVRHARRPHTVQEETPRPARLRVSAAGAPRPNHGLPASGAWRPAFRAFRGFRIAGEVTPRDINAGLGGRCRGAAEDNQNRGVFAAAAPMALRAAALAEVRQIGNRKDPSADRQGRPGQLERDRERLLDGIVRGIEVANRARPNWQVRTATARERHTRSNSALQAVDMHQGTDLDHPAEPSRRAASSNLEDRVETLRLEQVEAAKDLLGIRKGAVGD